MVQEAKEIQWWKAEVSPEHIGTISKIESRTMSDVMNILKNNGLGKIINRKMHDYNEAKRICFEGKFIDSDIYDKQIGWIIEFLKI